MDANKSPDYETSMWSETRWGGCFAPTDGVGLFLHAGRLEGNLDWWWAQTIAYLPDGRLAVERSWVRNQCEAGVRTPTLALRPDTDGWSGTFDGVVELTDIDRLAQSPGGASAPCMPMRFSVHGDDSRPVWDLYGGTRAKQDFAGGTHFEQGGTSRGTLEIGGQQFSLDGVSFWDHSSGVRDWRLFDHHHFALIVMPSFTIYEVSVFNADGALNRPVIGAWIDADGNEFPMSQADLPPLTDVRGAPQRFEAVFAHKGGKPITYAIEVVHAFVNTITASNENINGIDWTIGGDPLVATECMIKVTGPDGNVGYGHLERSVRRSAAVR